MASIILPYKNLGEAIEAKFDLANVPHKKLGDRSVLIDRSYKQPTLSIKVEATFTDDILQAFPATERSTPPLDVIATLYSVDAGIRTSVALKKQKPDFYQGVLSLDLTKISESAELAVIAVRSKSGTQGGFATYSGSRLAWSPAFEVRFVEPQTKGNFLETVWEDFSNSSVVPSGFDNALFYVDAEREPPVLYLNRLVNPSLIRLFETAGHGHAKALPRDVLFKSIASNVWLILAQSALATLHSAAAKGTPVDLETEFEGSWKLQMIKLIAPILLPSKMPDDSLQELCSEMDDENYYTKTLLTAQLAIQADQGIREQFERFAEKEFANG